MSAESSFYVRNRGQVTGPVSLDMLREQVRRGLLTPVHKLSADGQNWDFARVLLPALFLNSAGGSSLPSAPAGGGQAANGGASSAGPGRTLVDNPIVQPGVGSPEVTRIDQEIVDPPVAGQSHVAPASTHIPPQQPDETSWQVMLDGREYGPFSTQQMAANITEGRLTPLMMVWRAGMPEWVPAHAQFSFPAAAGNRAAGAALPPIKAPHIALGMAILSLVLSLPLAADRDWLGDGRLLIGVLIAALGGGAIFLVLREFNPQGRSTEDRLRTAAVWVAFAALAVGCLGAR